MNKNMVYDKDRIIVSCLMCGHPEEVICDKNTYDKILNRTDVIQRILPDVSPGVREMFITGWCDCCYDLQLMYFPAAALKELEEYSRKIMGDESITFECNEDVIDMLANYEQECDVPELADRIEKIRKEIHELAYRIDEGEFDDDEFEEEI